MLEKRARERGEMKQDDKNYPARYNSGQYTFPTDARAERVEFTDTHMIVYLQDGRFFGVPLAWVPSLADASPEDRAKVIISREGYSLHWDPAEGSINEDLRLADYMRAGPRGQGSIGRKLTALFEAIDAHFAVGDDYRVELGIWIWPGEEVPITY